jgi:hypothetical protein
MAENGVRRRAAAAGGCERAGRPATVARVRGRAGDGGAERWVGRSGGGAAVQRGRGRRRRCAGGDGGADAGGSDSNPAGPDEQ